MYRIVSHCIALHYIALHYITLQWITLQYITLCYKMMSVKTLYAMLENVSYAQEFPIQIKHLGMCIFVAVA